MQFDILGPLQVRDAGLPLVLGRPKQRAVLAILLLDAGRVVSLDRLVEELWGRQAPPQALASLQAYVSHLRRLLEPRRAPGAAATVLVNQAPGYCVVVADGQLDSVRFQTLAQRGHDLLGAGESSASAEVLAEALRLWRGPVLADFADASFVQLERARLGDLRLTALEDRLSADLSIGRHARIVAELEHLSAENPFRERFQALRMAALYRCGRQSEALQSYAHFREQLREELGLDPGPALRKLEHDILRQARDLDWTPPAGAEGARSGPTVPVATDSRPPGVAAGDGVSPAVGSGLVGRRGQLQQIDQALASASAGRGRVVLVSGEPGIGKTRLAEEAARRARGSGVTVAWGASDQDGGAPPFWPWVQVLRQLLSAAAADPATTRLGRHVEELALILPELTDGTLPAPAPVADVEASRFRLCQAATAALLQLSVGRRLLLVLDDLQWADVGSRRLLAHLAATLPEAPIVALVTYRDPTPDGGEPLADTLAALARTAPVDRLQLGGLGPAEVAQMMASRGGVDPDDELARLISERTGGNAFFVNEVLLLLGTSGWPRRTPADAASLVADHVPAGVRDVLRQRLSRLPDRTRSVLLVAAVIGLEFDLDVLRAVTGLDDDDALDAVELSVSAGLVVEDPAKVGRFRFAHALGREAVYAETTRARRARLHARVGQALIDHRGDHTEHVLQVAHHWWLAAPAVGVERTLPHVIAAADLCLATRAYEEAERQLLRSLDLLAAAASSKDRSACELGVQLRLGNLLVQLRGAGAQAAQAAFARARDLAEELDDGPAVLAAHRSLYEVAFARADHQVAGELAQAMVHMAERSDDPAVFTVGHLALGRTLWSQGRPVAAREQLELGLRMASGLDQASEFLPPQVTLHLTLAAVLDALDEPDAAAEHVSAAVQASRDASPFAIVITLTGAALVAAMRRDLPAARVWATQAVQTATTWNAPTPGDQAVVVLSWLDAIEGDSSGEAIVALRQQLDRIQAGGTQNLLAWGLGLLAEAHLRANQPVEALGLLDDALARVERTGERLHEPELHRLRALALMDLVPPRQAEARSAVRRAAEVAQQQGSALLVRRAVVTGRTMGAGSQNGRGDGEPGQPTRSGPPPV